MKNKDIRVTIGSSPTLWLGLSPKNIFGTDNFILIMDYEQESTKKWDYFKITNKDLTGPLNNV